VQSVKLRCVCFIRFCLTATSISSADSFRQLSLIFSVTFRDKITSFSQRSYLIASHILTPAKYRKIPQKYQNSAEKGKFRGLARNSADRGKL